MNCRTVKIVAIAIGVCFVAATASNALAAKDKAKHGVVVSVTAPVEASGKTPASPGSIKIKVFANKADKDGTETSYDLSDSVSVTVDGDPGKLSDIAANDKIGFVLTDGKVSKIMKGHKKPKV